MKFKDFLKESNDDSLSDAKIVQLVKDRSEDLDQLMYITGGSFDHLFYLDDIGFDTVRRVVEDNKKNWNKCYEMLEKYSTLISGDSVNERYEYSKLAKVLIDGQKKKDPLIMAILLDLKYFK